MKINASGMHFRDLNEEIRHSSDKKIVIDNCLGQRYIGSGQNGKNIVINGTPGNALGSYLDGCSVIVNGNAQDATGDTMNDGAIVVHGNCGDACGYAMRGGRIFVSGSAGYRAGIHMKAYEDKVPVIVIGGSVGSFLGEYQAGGNIVILGLESGGAVPVGNFCATGMHGGKIFIRADEEVKNLPAQVTSRVADEEDLGEVKSYIEEFCKHFSKDFNEIMNARFYVLVPDTKNPYKQLYTHN